MVEEYVLRGVTESGIVSYFTGLFPMVADEAHAKVFNNKVGARERALDLNSLTHVHGFRFIAIPKETR